MLTIWHDVRMQLKDQQNPQYYLLLTYRPKVECAPRGLYKLWKKINSFRKEASPEHPKKNFLRNIKK